MSKSSSSTPSHKLSSSSLKSVHPSKLPLVRHHIRALSNGLSKLKSTVSDTALKTYFDVKDQKDVSSTTAAAELKLAQLEVEALKGVARSIIGRSALRTKLFVKVVTSSGAGSALALVQGIVPSAAAEWSSFQQLFDDYRVMGVTSHFYFASSVASVAGSNPNYGVAYDATYNSAPTSVVALMQSDHHTIGALDAAANYPLTSHPGGGENGFRRFHVKEPRALIISPVAVTGGTGITANLPGGWIDMGDASSTASGYLKYYFEATTTSVVTLTQFLEYDVMFRQRT